MAGRTSLAEQPALVDHLRGSALSIPEFARQHPQCLASIRHWAKRRAAPPPSASFVEVSVVPAPNAYLEIPIGHGWPHFELLSPADRFSRPPFVVLGR